MRLFTVDSEKCNRDGICAAECPVGIIRFQGKESLPEPVENAEQFCINCGHCVSVCPAGALSLTTMPVESCEPIRKELRLEPGQAVQFLKSRRSIRTFQKKPVEREKIEKLIDTARYAPSGHNGQPVSWLVVHDTETVKSLTAGVVDWMRYMIEKKDPMVGPLHLDRVVSAWENGVDAICRNAPHLVIAHALKANGTAVPACTIAVAYLELAASSMGLGACWAGYFGHAAAFWPDLKASLDLPEGHVPMGTLLLGYPKFKYHRLPLRKTPDITWK